MSGFWLVAFALQWLFILLLALVLLAVARQVGLLNRRLPPVGARSGPPGPEIGTEAPLIEVPDVLGQPVSLGSTMGLNTLLVFLAPGCESCEIVGPGLRSISRSDESTTKLILTTGDSADSLKAYAGRHGLTAATLVASPKVELDFGLAAAPYGVAIDESGIVRAKGIVNNIEHLGSLLDALKTDDASNTASGADRIDVSVGDSV